MKKKALVIGINHYPFTQDQTGKALVLNKPADDAEAIAQLLETYGNFTVQRFPTVNIDGIWQIDRKPSNYKNQITALKQSIAQLFHPHQHIPDTALLYFSGLGLWESVANVKESFLATSDTDPAQDKWGISLNWLRQILADSPVKQQIIWLDCNHSENLLNFTETYGQFWEKGHDRCFIVTANAETFSSQYDSHDLQQIEKSNYLAEYLIEALDPENHQQKYVTNYSLVEYIYKQLTPQQPRPLFHNSGDDIILTGDPPQTNPGFSLATASGVCPYKGLTAFALNDQDPQYFYGRQNLVNLLLARVKSSNLLAVVGMSGSGKSSLIRAGLLPQIQSGQRLSGSEHWPIITLRPGFHPLESLAIALADYFYTITPSLERVRVASTQAEVVVNQNLSNGQAGLNGQSLSSNLSNNYQKKQLKLPVNDRQALLAEIELILQQEGASGLKQILETINEGRVIIFIDQFEEVFSLCGDYQERYQFFQCLMGCVDQNLGNLPHGGEKLTVSKNISNDIPAVFSSDSINQKNFDDLERELNSESDHNFNDHFTASLLLIITLRANFFGKCAEREYAGLARNIQNNLVTVVPMTELELKEVIIKPARKVGIDIQAELLPKILQDAKVTASLPLLQYTLTELWRQRISNQFTINDYEKLGDINNCLENTANDLYNTLSEKEKEATKRIFISLVHFSDWAEPTPKTVLKSDLVTPQQSLLIVSNILQKFVKARLLLTSQVKFSQEQKAVTVVNIAHESLLRYWSLLYNWLETERYGRRLAAQIESSAKLWQGNRKDPTTLLTGMKLGEIQDFIRDYPDTLVLSPLADQFLKVSIKSQKKAQQKQVNKLRLIIAGLGAFAVFTMGGWQRAEILRSQAETKQLNTEIQSLNTQSAKLFNDNQKFDALLASLKAGRLLKNSPNQVSNTNQLQVLTTLTQAIYGVRNRQTLAQHSHAINTVAFNYDGRAIASGDQAGKIKLWTIYGKEIATINASQKSIKQISWRRDGQMFVSGGEDGLVKLWDGRGKILKTFNNGHAGVINSLSFSPDGQNIASSDMYGNIKIWNLQGNIIQSWRGHGENITAIIFSPNGQNIATSSSDRTIKIWQRNGQLITTFNGHQDRVLSLQFSPDGKTLVSGSADQTLKLWSINDKREIGTIKGHESPINTVTFSSDGNMIASGSEDGVIKLWTAYGREIASLNGHSQSVKQINFSPDNLTLISASGDRSLILWSMSEQTLPSLKGHFDVVRDVSFSPNGKLIATASFDKTVKIWQTDGKLEETLRGHSGGVYSVNFSPVDDKLLVSGSADKTVRIWNIQEKVHNTLTGHTDEVKSVIFSPNGQWIASASGDKTVKIWDLKGKEIRTLTGHQYGLRSVAFSPNGKMLASAGYGGRGDAVKIWDMSGKEIIGISGLCLAVNSVAFSPNSKSLAIACSDKTVKLLDIQGKVLATMRGHTGEIYSVNFHPAGDLIASASDDGTIKLWNLQGKEIVTLTGQGDWVMDVSFNRNGNMIAGAGRNMIAVLWYLDLDRLMTLACNLTNDYLMKSSNIDKGDRTLCKGI
jgi:WD40 repeat protein